MLPYHTTAQREYGMAAYPTKYIYDDNFILISADINDSDWFVALHYLFLCHILFYMRLMSWIGRSPDLATRREGLRENEYS